MPVYTKGYERSLAIHKAREKIIERIFAIFSTAAHAKYVLDDMEPAAKFIEDFDDLAQSLNKEVRDKLRRGLFQILR